MKKFTGFIVICMALIVMGIGAVTFVHAANSATRFELTLKAIKQNNENILNVYSQQLRDSASVGTITNEALEEVFNTAIEAHYHMQGSQATMSWLREQVPNLDANGYSKLLKLTNEGRARFEKNQTLMVDAKQIYLEALDSFPSGLFMRISGFPTISVGYPYSSADDYRPDYPQQ